MTKANPQPNRPTHASPGCNGCNPHAGQDRHHRGSDAPSSDAARSPAHRLEPAEDFLKALSFSPADLVALGAGRSSVEPRRIAPFNTGNVRPDVVPAQVRDKVLYVVALVGAQGLGMNPAAPQVQIKEPAEQQVLIDQLAEQTVGANRIKGAEQLGLEQTLRWNRRAARPSVKPLKLTRNDRQRRLDQFLDPAQRVLGRNPEFDPEVEHRGRRIDFAAHRCCT